MSTFHLVAALCLGLPLLANGSPKECMTTVEGFTWDYDEDIDELIIGVDTVDLCYKVCSDDIECRGYTWTNTGVVQLCYKFKHQLHGYQECVACSSGVLSQAVNGACVGEYNDILDVGPADSVKECRQFCLRTDGCGAYTWWDNTSFSPNTCFLYAGCEAQVECGGCVSGRINCIFTGPNQCEEYMLLDDPDRGVNNEDCDFKSLWNINYFDYCYVDRIDSHRSSSYPGFTGPSADWQGPGYYRIMSSAGSRLPESRPKKYQCGTVYRGWLSGEHPQDIYAEKEMSVCFGNCDDDVEHVNITVTNCDGFFVYLLPEYPDNYGYYPEYYARYCVTH